MNILKLALSAVGIPILAGELHARNSAADVLRATANASASGASDRYKTAPAARGDVSQSITRTGTLNTVIQVEVGTQLSGQLAKVVANFNHELKPVQPLAELDWRSAQ